MASTFSPIQALDYCKRFIKNMPLEQVQTQILDDTSKYLWMANPWRWTIATFPQTTIISSTQDYSVALPADFLFLHDCYMYTPDTTNGYAIPRGLEIVAFLNTGGIVGQPNYVAITSGSPGGNGNLRFFPQPGIVPSGQFFSGYYKKQSPVIGPKDLYTAGIQVFDDEWFWVYESGVLYHAYLFGDDQRAGSAQIDASTGKVTFTGQRGVFEANIQLMREREKINLRRSPPEDPRSQ